MKKHVLFVLGGVPVVCLLLLAATLVFYVWLPARTAITAGGLLGGPRPVIAHRGASGLAPEETEAAYLIARDMGADYLEADAQITKDGAVVAFHDDTPARTTNVATVFPGRENDPISSFTLSELKQLDAGTWFNRKFPALARPKYAGARILTIDELCVIADMGNPRPRLYIEIKSPGRNSGCEAALVSVLKTRGWLECDEQGRGHVLFQSFSLDSLKRLQELAPNMPRIYLVGDGEEPWTKVLADAASVGAVGLGPVGYLGTPRKIGKAHRAGLAVHLYTLNDMWLYRLFSWMGADGFFTDRCDLALHFYGRKPHASREQILARYGY